MRYCRFEHEGAARYGLVEDIDGDPIVIKTLTSSPTAFSDFDRGESAELPMNLLRLLAPVKPTKIVCIGRNYREHAKELDHPIPTEPLFFLKPPTSLIGPDDEICRPIDLSQRVDHEGELGVVIGRRCYRIGESEDVRSSILGYTCVNDVTARDLQNKDGQWARAKGFDTFCPVGPVVTDSLDPWAGVDVETRVNGQVKQRGNTRDFIFTLDVILRYVTNAMTLMPGDLIATGTPQGVGPVVDGDAIEITVAGVGTLKNVVEDE